MKSTSADLPASPTAAPSAAPQGTATSEDRSTSFRAVEGGNQMQSGEKLLVEAYAIIWVLLFAMLLLAWRRQKKIDERISDLEQAVMKARAEASKTARREPERPAVKAAETQEAADA